MILSYLVRFSTDSVHKNSIFFLLFFFGFFFSLSFSFFFFFAFCLYVYVFLKLKIYILIRIRLCRQVGYKEIFTRAIFGSKTTFFGPNFLFFLLLALINVVEVVTLLMIHMLKYGFLIK